MVKRDIQVGDLVERVIGDFAGYKVGDRFIAKTVLTNNKGVGPHENQEHAFHDPVNLKIVTPEIIVSEVNNLYPIY